MPQSLRPKDQKKWLEVKYVLYQQHQNTKTLGLFYPPLYEEYFAKWPPIPTAHDLEGAGGNLATAKARVRGHEEHRIYRWMHNRNRSKHGLNGEGSSANLNLTGGRPKKKAAVQMYVKHYWNAKVKQAVIDRWSPTPETDLFGETDTGEDQVAWEALTPMEKNIPLWFRMEIGRKLYEAESDEVKAEIDRLREQEKEDAVEARSSSTTFTTEEERIEAMKRFNENFAKLAHSMKNLCSNVTREFGFHTSIIVGGPLVRDDGRLNVFTYESQGSVHKQLTFSEFLGQSYDTEVSEKFVDYLKHCFPKEERQLYTLKPSIATVATPSPPSDSPITPMSQPPPALHTAGPIHTQPKSTQARMRTGPMTPALKARILKNLANTRPKNDGPRADVVQAAAPPIDDGHGVLDDIPTRPAQPNQMTLISDPPINQQQPPGSQLSGDNHSDSLSYTSTIPDVFDVGMDDSAPVATGPWMIIDHLTGEMIVDEEELPATIPTVPSTRFDYAIQVQTIPALGVRALVQTAPPTLLFEDKDVRPDWLMKSTNEFLQYTPYYMCFSKVVDLFYEQEARLGYPDKSIRLALPSGNRPTEIAVFMKYGRKFSRGDNVDAEKFGAKVVEWWLTIQPTTRKAWPPTYKPLPEGFSFDYFNRGGPNGVFLMILCLSWWADALTTQTDHTSFKLVVHDVRWVLEQIASRA